MTDKPTGPVRKGWSDYTVARKVAENDIITSFYLKRADGDPHQPFHPGQFLTFKMAVPGQPRPFPRSYSISSAGDETGHYRISVKREPPPPDNPELAPGIASNYLHDLVEEGSTLVASGAKGDFFLDESSDRPVVLLSGGIGLTPMVSMLHALAQDAQRKTAFIHACEDGSVHALRSEVDALIAGAGNVTGHYCYRVPTPRDLEQNNHQSTGFVTADILSRHIDAAASEVYLCGPPAFMSAMYKTVRALGVDTARIHYEFFGPATVLEDDRT